MAFDALVGVGDDELDAAPATAGELAQERGPECLGLRRANIHAETLALAIAVDADCDDHRDRHNATILAHPHVGGVDPQIRPVAFDRTGEEGLHFVIDLGAEPADRWAAKPITSRNRSASGVFSHERRFVMSWVIVVPRLRWRVATRSYRRTTSDHRKAALPLRR